MTDTNTLAPTDAEILDAAEDFRSQYMHGGITFDEFDEIGFTRTALAKWGGSAPASSKPAAVPASGPVGFDHKTAANFLTGKTVTDEEVRRFVSHSRWAHDDRDWLRNAIADLRREIAQRDAEIALLKTSLLDAEARQQPAQALAMGRVPLSDKAVEQLICTNHFDPKYQLKESDRTVLSWYRLGLRDGERAHGIAAQEGCCAGQTAQKRRQSLI